MAILRDSVTPIGPGRSPTLLDLWQADGVQNVNNCQQFIYIFLSEYPTALRLEPLGICFLKKKIKDNGMPKHPLMSLDRLGPSQHALSRMQTPRGATIKSRESPDANK